MFVKVLIWSAILENLCDKKGQLNYLQKVAKSILNTVYWIIITLKCGLAKFKHHLYKWLGYIA